MPKLTRYLQKIFANNSNEVGVFGTGVDKETSKNVETLQSADYENGWSSAIITNKNYPIWQEMDGVQYGLSYQLKYLFQNGVPEWISTETYYTNQFCAYGGYIYQSLQDNNINHNPALNNGYWTVYSSVSDDRLHALKSYKDEGELLTDSEGLADIKSYATSTFDLSKFTVVGSPIITDDGIASGFSGSNYLTQDIDFSKPFKLDIKIKTPPSVPSSVKYFLLTSTRGIACQYSTTGVLGIKVATTAWGSDLINATLSAEVNTEYLIEIEWTGTQYICKVNGTQIDSNTSTAQVLAGVLQIGGYPTQDTSSFAGSIDLKQFSITVDGVEVFSGNQTGVDTYTIGGLTVTIPYTLSKTGSKIVDSAYRTQVASVYNYQGYAPYYTLSDTDFTLPQGELYGMMLNRSTPHIVESYVSGTSGYNVYSNGYCEQWGYAKENVSISLFKEYKTTDYAIFLTRTSTEEYAFAPTVQEQYTDSFKYQVAPDVIGDSYSYWLTKGYIN